MNNGCYVPAIKVRDIKALSETVLRPQIRLSVGLSVSCPSKRCVLELWLLWNTNRKLHVESQTKRSTWL